MTFTLYIYIHYIYLVIYGWCFNLLLFQAPKILLNIEVIEAVILKPVGTNGT